MLIDPYSLMLAGSLAANISIWMWMAYHSHFQKSEETPSCGPLTPVTASKGSPKAGSACPTKSGYMGRLLVPGLCRPQRRVLFGPEFTT